MSRPSDLAYHKRCGPVISEHLGPNPGHPNAAPEWQAGSLEWRSKVRMEACPLKGPVGKCSSPLAETSQDGVLIRQISQYLNQAKIGGRPWDA
jgi:hypothetical protein